ncbi:Putative calcium-binding protein CML23 [Eumeta japonica]|uniref:Calcium-binding protein CML23 n=1 Tax=Eumeta variegata TaxID=151549 RepID=A0A4C1VKE7_EUMVA|nr:Putative calcium-binding protein CML23 [Eumeta japonica]
MQRETTVSIPLTPTRSDLYWRRIFDKYDRDKDGRISYTELKDIIESREYDHDLPDNVVDKIMKLADKDNSGYLDFAEFVEMMQNPDLKMIFGHFVARYVHTIVPYRRPVDTTEFKHDRVNLSDEFLDDHPSITVNNKNIDAARHLIETNRHVTYHAIRASLGTDMCQIRSILYKYLSMKKLCSRWIPRKLSEAQKTDRITALPDSRKGLQE